MQERYKKKISAELDREFQEARQLGLVKVGSVNLFWRNKLRWFYLPAAEITQAYRRIEQVESHTSCCETDFSIHRLILMLKDGTELVVFIGESMYRHEPEMLMDEIRKNHPHIEIAAPHVRKK